MSLTSILAPGEPEVFAKDTSALGVILPGSYQLHPALECGEVRFGVQVVGFGLCGGVEFEEEILALTPDWRK